jgi:hypothetical protein
MNRKTLLTILAAVIALGNAACSGGGHKRITVTISGPATATEGVAVMFTATVNDAQGVTWTCTTTGTAACSSTNFNPAATLSGGATSFTPPSAVETVTITATSVANSSATATKTVTISSGIAVALSTPPPNSMTEGTTAQVAATVTGDSAMAGVAWTCTTTGATACSSANFNPATTASGVATTFTAPSGAETVTITATSVTDNTQSASANITITVATTSISGTFSFFVAGTDDFDDENYALAGSVTINNGTVTGGVQDFNDGLGLISAEPGGDAITGGTLSADASGQGTLTLVTNNAGFGTETLAIVLVNGSHALITQFDGNATSTGTLDLQTSLSTLPSGSFSFAVAGIHPGFSPIVAGGVFTITSGALNGTIDVDDAGTTTLGTAFSGTVTAPDGATGRGTITNSSLGVSVVYYNVGPEVIRIVVVDATDFEAGSAFGQGTAAAAAAAAGGSTNARLAAAFSNASLGQSVFTVSGTNIFNPFVLVGQLTPNATMGTFNGVLDVNLAGNFAFASPVSGTFSIPANGYGNLQITSGVSAGASLFGLYATDPTLNLNDPNNLTGGGGALLVDLDPGMSAGFFINSIGVVVPQTDTSVSSAQGGYAFQGQFREPNDEADFTGQGTLVAGTQGGASGLTFSGTGALNDPFGDFGTIKLNNGVTFSGFFQPDASNPGRYDVNGGLVSIPGETPLTVAVSAYQANGSQIFWLEEDTNSLFGGQLQQQAATLPTVTKAAAKSRQKH